MLWLDGQAQFLATRNQGQDGTSSPHIGRIANLDTVRRPRQARTFQRLQSIISTPERLACKDPRPRPGEPEPLRLGPLKPSPRLGRRIANQAHVCRVLELRRNQTSLGVVLGELKDLLAHQVEAAPH